MQVEALFETSLEIRGVVERANLRRRGGSALVDG